MGTALLTTSNSSSDRSWISGEMGSRPHSRQPPCPSASSCKISVRTATAAASGCASSQAVVRARKAGCQVSSSSCRAKYSPSLASRPFCALPLRPRFCDRCSTAIFSCKAGGWAARRASTPAASPPSLITSACQSVKVCAAMSASARARNGRRSLLRMMMATFAM